MATIAGHMSIAELEERFRSAAEPVKGRHFQAIWLLAKGRTFVEAAEVLAFAPGAGGVTDRRGWARRRRHACIILLRPRFYDLRRARRREQQGSDKSDIIDAEKCGAEARSSFGSIRRAIELAAMGELISKGLQPVQLTPNDVRQLCNSQSPSECGQQDVQLMAVGGRSSQEIVDALGRYCARQKISH